MRILTVRQPWAWAIIHGGKNVENRVRNIAGDYRGPVAIHAAHADAEGAPNSLWLEHAEWYRARKPQPKVFDPAWSDRGAIIGVVDLVDVHRACWDGCHSDGNVDLPDSHRELCSSWAEVKVHHLVVDNPRPLSEPIPFKGALGLRRLDADTIAAIEAQLT